MTPEAINSVINNICAKLELPTAKGFEYLCAIGIKDVAATVVSFILALLSAYITYRTVKKLERQKGPTDYSECLLPIFCCVAAFMVFILTLGDTLLYLVSPEAWAVQYLLDKF